MNKTNHQQRRAQRNKQSKINKQLRKRLFADLVFAPCCYCLKGFLVENLTIEHIIPRCFNGNNNDDNIDLACAPCNQAKGKEACFLKKKVMKEQWQIINLPGLHLSNQRN